METIRSELLAVLLEGEIAQQVDKIIEGRYPKIVENQRYDQLMALEDSIMTIIENYNAAQ